MTNTMPVLTEGQRQSLIADCKAEIADLEGFIESCKPKFTDNYSATNLYQIKSQLLRQQIALASLEAKPKGFVQGMLYGMDTFKLKGFFGSDLKLDDHIYTAPPVSALKLPEKASCDGLNPKEWREARTLGQCEGWNACLYELKRLNGVTE